MSIVSTPRLAAGDWVILEGKEPSRRGVGKIVDGSYAADSDVLEAARVEFSNGTSWFGVGDLSRVTPEEEAAICSDALAGGHVPVERAAGLRREIEDLRASKLVFVRSPGLLDRLWACLPEDPPPERRSGLARFFDESRSSVMAWRSGASRVNRGPQPETRKSDASEGRTLESIVASLDERDLRVHCRSLDVPGVLEGASVEALRTGLLAALRVHERPPRWVATTPRQVLVASLSIVALLRSLRKAQVRMPEHGLSDDQLRALAAMSVPPALIVAHLTRDQIESCARTLGWPAQSDIEAVRAELLRAATYPSRSS